MKTVAFVNYCNCGDLHVSRELVRYVVEHAGADRYIYFHRNSNRILQDIDGLEQRHLDSSGLPPAAQDEASVEGVVDGEPAIFLSTWYATSPVWQKGRGLGCSLNTLYELFRQHMRKHFQHEITRPVEDFIPAIKWSCDAYSESVIDAVSRLSLIASKYNQTVLVCNGQPLSGQTRIDGAAFELAICEWIDANPDVLFLVSNKEGALAVSRPNVAHTADIIGLPAGICDLPENGFLSTKCNIVVGRASGAYTFAYLAENFLDSKKTMVCFTDDEKTARWVYPPDTVKARILWSGGRGYEDARATLAGVLW